MLKHLSQFLRAFYSFDIISEAEGISSNIPKALVEKLHREDACRLGFG